MYQMICPVLEVFQAMEGLDASDGAVTEAEIDEVRRDLRSQLAGHRQVSPSASARDAKLSRSSSNTGTSAKSGAGKRGSTAERFPLGALAAANSRAADRVDGGGSARLTTCATNRGTVEWAAENERTYSQWARTLVIGSRVCSAQRQPLRFMRCRDEDGAGANPPVG